MDKIILVRHGQTNKNIDGALHSIGDSESLNDEGILQMKQVAEKLKAFSTARIYSSKEKRAVQSAQILDETLHAGVAVVQGIEERNWGDIYILRQRVNPGNISRVG
jgi:broad specificity phosphatase PhoE